MFGLFSKKRDSQKRKAAKQLLDMAEKVYNYRRDVIAPDDARQLSILIDELDSLVMDSKVETAQFEKGADKLEKLLRRCGGRIYPLTSWTDNVETVIVAGILALGVRSFFLQPFKIPTNSMYPSFYGMTPQVYKSSAEAPKGFEKLARLALKGAVNYETISPADGELFAVLNEPDKMAFFGSVFAYDTANRKLLGVWPTSKRAYKFKIKTKDGSVRDVSVDVPMEFPLDDVILETYFGGEDLRKFVSSLMDGGRRVVDLGGVPAVSLGKISKGSPILNFDILTGDMLFVDRFTYNFRDPKVGESIVFLTKYCDGLTARNGGKPDDKYYIKRLVGIGGDVLEIKDSVLYRNGSPITGAAAFSKNAKKVDGYKGYQAAGALETGAKVRVPENNYYAMGDNSYNSLDSRFWGFVPQKAMVGKSIVIFYPFTNIWGATR